MREGGSDGDGRQYGRAAKGSRRREGTGERASRSVILVVNIRRHMPKGIKSSKYCVDTSFRFPIGTHSGHSMR